MARWLKIIPLLFPTLGSAAQVDLLRCVSEVKAVSGDQRSELFLSDGLAFGVRDGVLLIANDRDSFAFRFGKNQRRSVRMLIPHSDPRRVPQMIYLTFLHSEVYGSHLVDFSIDGPAPGRKLLEYEMVSPLQFRSQMKRRYISQMILGELESISRRFRQGELSRVDLLSGNLSLCRGIASEDLVANRKLNLQVNELELVSTENPRGGRLPASLGF